MRASRSIRGEPTCSRVALTAAANPATARRPCLMRSLEGSNRPKLIAVNVIGEGSDSMSASPGTSMLVSALDRPSRSARRSLSSGPTPNA